MALTSTTFGLVVILGIISIYFFLKQRDNRLFIKYSTYSTLSSSLLLTSAIFWFWQGEVAIPALLMIAFSLVFYLSATQAILFSLALLLFKFLTKGKIVYFAISLLLGVSILPITIALSLFNYKASIYEMIILNTIAFAIGVITGIICTPKLKSGYPTA